MANKLIDKTKAFTKQEFIPNLSADELNDIVTNKMREINFGMLDKEYSALSPANQRALEHLVKAADILDKVFLKQDQPDNIRAKEHLEREAAKGDKWAQQALTLFTLHNGVEGVDMYARKSVPIDLFKDKKLQPGKGFYPQDLTEDELVKYILKHPEQASALLGSNTMVQRQGKNLIAVPYSQAFPKEMAEASYELIAAANETDHAGLAKYLRLQAAALTNDSDPQTVYEADKSCANDLEGSPLEFTIGRENYEDRLSSQTAVDPRLAKVLKGVVTKSKDSMSARVGIINHDSDPWFKFYKDNLPEVIKRMPLRDQYDVQDNGPMNTADVDLVAFMGDYAANRGGITIAQNLPNSDKLAVQLKAGRRLVFHRQIRQSVDPVAQKKMLDAVVDKSQQALYDSESDFYFTIGHEFGHSLGPGTTRDGRDKSAALGAYGSMLEENKADLISIFMTGILKDQGKYTEEQANKIFLTWAVGELPFKQPAPEEAHRSRSLMQVNYFREKGAIILEKGQPMKIVPEKMASAAEQMLKEVIQLQLDGDPVKAEAFVKKYAVWNDAMQYAADQKMSLQPKLYRLMKQPLRDKLLKLHAAPARAPARKPSM